MSNVYTDNTVLNLDSTLQLKHFFHIKLTKIKNNAIIPLIK